MRLPLPDELALRQVILPSAATLPLTGMPLLLRPVTAPFSIEISPLVELNVQPTPPFAVTSYVPS